MQDRPDSAGLLEAALAVYRRELLPEIPPAKRYLALMVANAMGIVARDLATEEESLREECRRLQELVGISLPEIQDCKTPRQEAEALNRRLVAAIREGTYDAPSADREKLKAHLLATTREKLRASNPKCVTGEGKSE